MFIALGIAPLTAFANTPPAASIMAKAEAQAKTEHKNVLVIFHASWCGWCHKLDDMLATKDAGGVMSKAYVIVHLTVDESKDKLDLENPGASDFRNELGGSKAGLPYFAVVSPKGKKLADSIAPKTGNTGYPAEPQEIDYFMQIFKKTAPQIKPAEAATVETYMRDMGKKIKAAQTRH